MRYIHKGEEPTSLTKYKKESNAYFDGYAEKNDVREQLLKEQGYLCGYCMKRIKNVEDVKIEHVVPQSDLIEDERKALDYKIMVGVCYGNEGNARGKKSLTCDAHRGNDDIYVTPFDEYGISQIKYDSEGYITSENENIRRTVEETLNLNYDGPDAYLVQNRKAVLSECKKKLRKMQKTGIWKKNNLEKLLRYYMQPNENGEYVPFSGIAIWYINKKMQNA